MIKIAAFILTFNEEIHISRCIKNLKELTTNIYVIDSFSTDKTVEIARKQSVKILFRKFDNHSEQINWALSKINSDIEWILRIDADEIISAALIAEIKEKLPTITKKYSGIYIPRRINFRGHIIRFGGVFPSKIIRLFKNGFGFCEKRLMDEKFVIRGKCISLENELIDYNLKSFSWWLKKHNSYSSKEAIELLNKDFKFIKKNQNMDLKKINKNNKKDLYYKFPIFLRAILYFIYRYFLKLGFLDGYRGFIFHFFQGFLYRFIVDLKYYRVHKILKRSNKNLSKIIYDNLGVEIIEE